LAIKRAISNVSALVVALGVVVVDDILLIRYLIVVVEDTTKHTLVGCATLLVERKFIRSAASAGHIEGGVANIIQTLVDTKQFSQMW
jgi:hypothetical protein